MAKNYFKTTIVIFTFINSKGLEKTVKFPMDEKYYKDLFHPSVTKEQRDEVLLSEYREYCKEQKYQRRHVSFLEDEDGNYIEPADDSITYLDQMIIDEEKKDLHNKLMDLLNQLSKKQSQAIILIYINGLKQKDAAKQMNIAENTFSELIKRAQKSLEKLIGKKIF